MNRHSGIDTQQCLYLEQDWKVVLLHNVLNETTNVFFEILKSA
jgi:hypothetical protein